MHSDDLESRGGKTREQGRETQWTSWLIGLFIVANVAMFVVSMYVNNCPKHNPGSEGKCVARFLGRFSFHPWADNPLLCSVLLHQQKLGALERTKVVNKHQGWRLITCIWLHADTIHLFANMMCLVTIGICLEKQFGLVRIGTIYLLSGFGGIVLSSLFIQHNIYVGASGALFWLLGAMPSELIANWTIHTNKARGRVGDALPRSRWK